MSDLSLESLLGLNTTPVSRTFQDGTTANPPKHSLTSVKLTTILDTSIQGKVHCFDTATNTLTLIVASNGNKHTFRIVRTPFVKSAEITSRRNNGVRRKFTSFKTAEPLITPIDIEASKAKDLEIQRKLDRERVAKLREKHISSMASHLTSPVARQVYLKATKLFPIEEISVTNSQDIVIFGNVKVSKPYGLGEVEFVKGDSEKDSKALSTLEFVKSIVRDVNEAVAGG